MSHHELKTVNPFFRDIVDGLKQFEIRKNDRDYKQGDTVTLYEYNPINKCATSRWVNVKITYVLYHHDFPDGIKEGYCIFGFTELNRINC